MGPRSWVTDAGIADVDVVEAVVVVAPATLAEVEAFVDVAADACGSVAGSVSVT